MTFPEPQLAEATERYNKLMDRVTALLGDEHKALVLELDSAVGAYAIECANSATIAHGRQILDAITGASLEWPSEPDESRSAVTEQWRDRVREANPELVA